VRHLIGTASAWGLNPDRDAIYLDITSAKSDGKGIYKLEVQANVPVDGCWASQLRGCLALLPGASMPRFRARRNLL
jgi:hypothetical protein